DRQRPVGIGEAFLILLHEMLARNLVHRAQHRRVPDPALAQREQEFHAADIVVAGLNDGHAALLPHPNTYSASARRVRRRARRSQARRQANTAASAVMNGSSVRSSRSGVTEMRFSVSAARSVPELPAGLPRRAKASQ